MAACFVEYRTGINHGKGLPKYGIEPLYSLFQWPNRFPAKDKLKVETTLHLAPKAAVPRVTGDAKWGAPTGTDLG